MKLQKIEHTTSNQRIRQMLIIKTFPDREAGHAWLNKQDNNDWKEHTGGLKAGKYVIAGGEWRNVKSLEPEVLAHCW